MRKNSINLLTSLLFLMVGIFIFIFILKIRLYIKDKEFKEVTLNSSSLKIQEKWGKPDEEYDCEKCAGDGDKVFIYHRDLLDGNYVFVFKKKEDILVFKRIE